MIKSRKKTATEQEFLINKLTNLKMIKTNLFRLKKVKKRDSSVYQISKYFELINLVNSKQNTCLFI